MKISLLEEDYGKCDTQTLIKYYEQQDKSHLPFRKSKI